MAMDSTSSGGTFLRYDVDIAQKRHPTTKVSSSDCSTKNYNILALEIDGDGAGACNNIKQHSIHLCKYQEAPAHLKGNPYVVGGYRSTLPLSQCCKSLFVWSNETVNIWTHLVGYLLFGFLVIYDNFILLPAYSASLSDHIILTIALFCFQFCLIASAGYHLFNCHSERAAKRWLALDLTGISVGLIGCYLPGVHYAFYCLSIWRDIYLIVICGLFMAVLMFQTRPHYISSGMFAHRAIIYCGLVGYGIIPTVHWIYLNGGSTTPIVQLFLPKVATMYALGVLAFFFYLTKFPERYMPGYFDFVGASHQLWHIIILIAFIFWHSAGGEIVKYRIETPCVT